MKCELAASLLIVRAQRGNFGESGRRFGNDEMKWQLNLRTDAAGAKVGIVFENEGEKENILMVAWQKSVGSDRVVERREGWRVSGAKDDTKDGFNFFLQKIARLVGYRLQEKATDLKPKY